jgi:CRISPR-associated endonuclease/helicase Cas3
VTETSPPFWGKSNAAGRPHLLLQHLFDTAAVAELMWDRWLPPAFCASIDGCSDGRGRDLFRLVAALHDVGKATPAFQSKVPELAARLATHGLRTGRLTSEDKALRHDRAGAYVLRAVLPGWRTGSQAWLWPLVAGHHGRVCAASEVGEDGVPRRGVGDRAWEMAQQALATAVVTGLGFSVDALPDSAPPPRSQQLALSGFVIMADWLASDDKNFGGVDDITQVSLDAARDRAAAAWDAVGLRRGWSPTGLSESAESFAATFRFAPRPGQRAALNAAATMAEPGLLVIEAPMGEGKTEAALAAVEVLAARFGCDGLFVGMPTQATSDAMYSRIRTWVRHIDRSLPVALLHGKRHFNKEWRSLEPAVAYRGVDEYGCSDDFGSQPGRPTSGLLPAEWLLGRKRGLLSPLAIGTIDQLLHAATRTKHVALRHAGLAGKVVVLDEVHAYDVYMSQFLLEALRWLGDARVPVVLLSATLPPTMRHDLTRAYLQGRFGDRDINVELPSSGYPSALTACARGGRPVVHTQAAALHRASLSVAVDVLGTSGKDDAEGIADLMRGQLAEGGCALVVCNTVGRAQAAYVAVKECFPSQVVLLHGRLTVGERTDRAEEVLRLLGPSAEERPARLIVVATQIAEQSFDIDADLLVSDLAPIDLLLQRCGRLHRHDRSARPTRVGRPRLVVTGLTPQADGPPELARGSVAVYGAYPLFRAASLVLSATSGWQVPGQVPSLVQQAYDPDGQLPERWSAAVADARSRWQREQDLRAERARQFLLAGEDELGRETLAGLHARSIADLDDDDAVAAVVRDGEESAEVVLVRRDVTGYRTLAGRSLGVDGSVAVTDDQVLEEVLRSTLRLPARVEVSTAAHELRPLPGWQADSWLRHSRALVLDADGETELGSRTLRYDAELGLVDHATRRTSTPPHGGDNEALGTTSGAPRR